MSFLCWEIWFRSPPFDIASLHDRHDSRTMFEINLSTPWPLYGTDGRQFVPKTIERESSKALKSDQSIKAYGIIGQYSQNYRKLRCCKTETTEFYVSLLGKYVHRHTAATDLSIHFARQMHSQAHIRCLC